MFAGKGVQKMVENVIEVTLYGLMTAIYVIADKKELFQPVLVRRNERPVRPRPVGR